MTPDPIFYLIYRIIWWAISIAVIFLVYLIFYPPDKKEE
jgi:hypothetical protein